MKAMKKWRKMEKMEKMKNSYFIWEKTSEEWMFKLRIE